MSIRLSSRLQGQTRHVQNAVLGVKPLPKPLVEVVAAEAVDAGVATKAEADAIAAVVSNEVAEEEVETEMEVEAAGTKVAAAEERIVPTTSSPRPR